ncbi:UNVERIFIED_CONTAM: hypothetical protein FKN15_008794 [Acipenser sinensis]
MLTYPPTRRALIVGCGLQMFQQLSGINTVMYYSATILQMSGVKDDKMAIWLAAVTAFTNFTFTMLGVWLVEKVGRRKLSLGSIAVLVRLTVFIKQCDSLARSGVVDDVTDQEVTETKTVDGRVKLNIAVFSVFIKQKQKQKI